MRRVRDPGREWATTEGRSRRFFKILPRSEADVAQTLRIDKAARAIRIRRELEKVIAASRSPGRGLIFDLQRSLAC